MKRKTIFKYILKDKFDFIYCIRSRKYNIELGGLCDYDVFHVKNVLPKLIKYLNEFFKCRDLSKSFLTPEKEQFYLITNNLTKRTIITE